MPLAGLRVLDVATFIAGPFCATVLSEFGADVIKIEHPAMSDPLRQMGTPVDGGETLTWLSEARNKKTVTLNLGKPEGAELFRDMVRKADIVVENFRPGTMERWGLGYEQLKAVNERIIMLRISAYGQDGPYSSRPGFARIAHAFAGLSYLAGVPDGPPVVPGSTSLADYLSGMYGVIGTLIALHELKSSGEGQFIDVALYEPIFRVLDELAPAYAKTGHIRERLGADAPTLAPHSHYQCADGQWIALACSSDKLFTRLAEVMQRTDLLNDPRFDRMYKRVENREALNEIVAAWIGSFPRAGFIELCLSNDIPCGPINSIADIFEDPQFKARGNLLAMSDPDAGEVVVPNVVPRLSRTPGSVRHLGRHRGADNDAVFGELLGLSDGELQRLKSSGVI